MAEVKLSTKEKNLLKLLEDRDRLADQVSLCDKAIGFWESQMETLFVKIDENDEQSWSPDYEAKAERYLKDIDRLVGRGKIENDTINKLEQESDDLYFKIITFLEENANNKKIINIAKNHFKKIKN
jgi:hypothetical protein